MNEHGGYSVNVLGSISSYITVLTADVLIRTKKCTSVLKLIIVKIKNVLGQKNFEKVIIDLRNQTKKSLLLRGSFLG